MKECSKRWTMYMQGQKNKHHRWSHNPRPSPNGCGSLSNVFVIIISRSSRWWFELCFLFSPPKNWGSQKKLKTHFDATYWFPKARTNQQTNQSVFVTGLFGPFSWLFFGYSFGQPSSGVDVVSWLASTGFSLGGVWGKFQTLVSQHVLPLHTRKYFN